MAEGKDSGTAQEVRTPVHMELGDMNLEGAERVRGEKKRRSSVGKPAGVVRGREGQSN